MNGVRKSTATIDPAPPPFRRHSRNNPTPIAVGFETPVACISDWLTITDTSRLTLPDAEAR